MRQVLLGLLVVTTAACAAIGQSVPRKVDQSCSLPAAIKAISPSIVQITYEMDELPPETSQALGRLFLVGPAGTGFIVKADGDIVTALHVLNFFDQLHGIPVNGRSYPAGRNRLLVSVQLPNEDAEGRHIRGSFSDFAFSVIDTDPAHDLALLKAERRIFGLLAAPSVRLSVGRPADGERVAVSGYPLGKTILVTTSGSVASSWDYEPEAYTLPEWPEIRIPHDIREIFLVDLRLNHGNSGGPVYSADTGAVIGMADAYALDNVMLKPLPEGQAEPALDPRSGRALMANAGLGVVVPSRYIVELLKKNSLKWIEK